MTRYAQNIHMHRETERGGTGGEKERGREGERQPECRLPSSVMPCHPHQCNTAYLNTHTHSNHEVQEGLHLRLQLRPVVLVEVKQDAQGNERVVLVVTLCKEEAGRQMRGRRNVWRQLETSCARQPVHSPHCQRKTRAGKCLGRQIFEVA